MRIHAPLLALLLLLPMAPAGADSEESGVLTAVAVHLPEDEVLIAWAPTVVLPEAYRIYGREVGGDWEFITEVEATAVATKIADTHAEYGVAAVLDASSVVVITAAHDIPKIPYCLVVQDNPPAVGICVPYVGNISIPP